jgi:hypothetical protein
LVNGCNVLEVNALAFAGVFLLGSERSWWRMVSNGIVDYAASWRQNLRWDGKRGNITQALDTSTRSREWTGDDYADAALWTGANLYNSDDVTETRIH